MALSEKTINKHNLKRAEVFKANGLCDLDVAFAHPAFAGYATNSQDCVLCGHKHIKWLFAIRFGAPDMTTMLGKITTGITRTEEVTLKHVGSKCITDWLDAVPESTEKLEALKRWAVEMDKCKKAMVAKVVEDLCAQAGYSPESAADTWQNLLEDCGSHALVKIVGWKTFAFLRNNVRGIRYRTSSRATVKRWLESLATLVASHTATQETALEEPVKQIEETSAPIDPDSIEGLLARANAVLDDPVKRGRLSPNHQLVVADIAAKVQKYGSFAPGGRQRGFFTSLLKRAETGPEVGEETLPAAAPKPGDPNYVSPSGIPGARY